MVESTTACLFMLHWYSPFWLFSFLPPPLLLSEGTASFHDLEKFFFVDGAVPVSVGSA